MLCNSFVSMIPHSIALPGCGSRERGGKGKKKKKKRGRERERRARNISCCYKTLKRKLEKKNLLGGERLPWVSSTVYPVELLLMSRPKTWREGTDPKRSLVITPVNICFLLMLTVVFLARESALKERLGLPWQGEQCSGLWSSRHTCIVGLNLNIHKVECPSWDLPGAVVALVMRQLSWHATSLIPMFSCKLEGYLP